MTMRMVDILQSANSTMNAINYYSQSMIGRQRTDEVPEAIGDMPRVWFRLINTLG